MTKINHVNKKLFCIIENGNNLSMKCSLWNLPEDVQTSINSTHNSLNHLGDLPVESTINAIWEPNNSNSSIVSISENCIYHFDCNTNQPRVS